MRIQRKMVHAVLSFASFCLLVFVLPGCGKRTVYVRDEEPVRLAAPIKNAPVWTVDKDGKEYKTTKTLQEGTWNVAFPEDPKPK